MKKIYKKPAANYCEISTSSLLAGSLQFDTPEDLSSGNLDARDRDFGFDFSNDEEGSIW